MIVIGHEKHMENALGLSRRIHKRDISVCVVYVYVFMKNITMQIHNTHMYMITYKFVACVPFACSELGLCVLPSYTLHHT